MAKELEIKLKEKGLIKRLTNKTFKFDKGFGTYFFSANYFVKTKEIVENHLAENICTMQFFQRQDDVMLCGIDEVIALLETFSPNYKSLKIYTLNDGDIVSKNEPVLKIIGPYQNFGFLESAIDGILARRSSVATNCYRLLKVVSSNRVLDMADRQDDPYTQQGDGYAAYVAGIRYFSTDAQGSWVGIKAGGTMPHALIALCGGDIKKAVNLYHEQFPHQKVTALIDYRNDVIKDTLLVANLLKEDLQAVRVDTSQSMIDHYFDDKRQFYDIDEIRGVNKYLINDLRKELDKNDFSYVQIIVSSGFDVEKIKEFEKEKVPVDIYGVGTSLLKNNVGFTGDIVNVNGKEQAKEGRKELFSERLQLVS